MNIEKYKLSDLYDVQKFLQGREDSCLGQDPRWINVVTETFKHQNSALLIKEAGNIQAFIPLITVNSELFGRSIISMPYINSGGIVAATYNHSDLLAKRICELHEKSAVKYSEIRCVSNLDKVYSGYTQIVKKVSFRLRLKETADELLSSFNSKLRSQIRNSNKSSAVFEISSGADCSEKQIIDFYKVFAEHMRDLGTPVYPRSLFKNTVEFFKDDALIVNGYINGIPACGGVLVKHKNTFELIWAATLRKHNSQSLNMLMYWKIMEYLISLGIQYFDFGRTSPGSGGYNFKKQWGAEEYPLYWYYYGDKQYFPDISPGNQRFSWKVKIWQKLPVWLANMAGPIVTRHIP